MYPVSVIRAKATGEALSDILAGMRRSGIRGTPSSDSRSFLAAENSQLRTENWFKKSRSRLPQMSLFAHRGQPLQIRYRFLHCDPITKGDNPA